MKKMSVRRSKSNEYYLTSEQINRLLAEGAKVRHAPEDNGAQVGVYRKDGKAVPVKAGDTLTINGQELDLATVAQGESVEATFPYWQTIIIDSPEMVKELRETLGLSQEKMGQRYGIPKRTIEDWETGKMTPPAYTLRLLERAVMEDADIIEAYDNGSVHDEYKGAETIIRYECEPTKWSEVAQIVNEGQDEPYTISELKRSYREGYFRIYKDGVVELYL